ncbi:alanine racemase [uncultured Roseovarius sp.]|uniref:alanine racemase n=1 Tax=uncultured Roseovarius sp. TaxID=293344 RepID=UPI0026286404|nr:alanine racemase [uncultured Roseovarius sp.]
MTGARVEIDLKMIEENARKLAAICGGYGVEITGVSKATIGMPQVARAMLRGGLSGIGESRLEGVQRLRAAGIVAPLMLLRIPSLSSVQEVVELTDVSLNSEYTVIEALSKAAVQNGCVHEIIIMVELGDLREGVWPEELVPLVEKVVELPGVRIVGLGTNLTCYGGVIPTEANLGALVDHADELVGKFGLDLRFVSGGNSSTLPLLFSGKLPQQVNHLRLGESVLLGKETVNQTAWPGSRQKAFLLRAEIIEFKDKPSCPIGEVGRDAFGRKNKFEDRGRQKRGIVNVGRADLNIEGLTPTDPKIKVIGASSDHLILDLSSTSQNVSLEDTVSFFMDYSALIGAMSSVSIEKEISGEEPEQSLRKNISLIVPREPAGFEHGKLNVLSHNLKDLGYSVQLVGEAGDDLRIGRQVSKAASSGELPLIIGGSEITARSAISGLSEQLSSLGVIWIDATPGLVPDSAQTDGDERVGQNIQITCNGGLFATTSDKLLLENVVLVGLRGGDPQKLDSIIKSSITTYTMEDIDASGMPRVLRESMRQASAGTAGFLVYLNPHSMENRRGVRQIGTLTYREMCHAMELIADSGLLRALVVAEFDGKCNPAFQEDISGVILSAFGKKIINKIRD